MKFWRLRQLTNIFIEIPLQLSSHCSIGSSKLGIGFKSCSQGWHLLQLTQPWSTKTLFLFHCSQGISSEFINTKCRSLCKYNFWGYIKMIKFDPQPLWIVKTSSPHPENKSFAMWKIGYPSSQNILQIFKNNPLRKWKSQTSLPIPPQATPIPIQNELPPNAPIPSLGQSQ